MLVEAGAGADFHEVEGLPQAGKSGQETNGAAGLVRLRRAGEEIGHEVPMGKEGCACRVQHGLHWRVLTGGRVDRDQAGVATGQDQGMQRAGHPQRSGIGRLRREWTRAAEQEVIQRPAIAKAVGKPSQERRIERRAKAFAPVGLLAEMGGVRFQCV